MGGSRGIGWAVESMRKGAKVRRRGWNGKGMHLELVDGACRSLPYIRMKTADDSSVPWVANQTDLLDEDWEVTS